MLELVNSAEMVDRDTESAQKKGIDDGEAYSEKTLLHHDLARQDGNLVYAISMENDERDMCQDGVVSTRHWPAVVD